jgi:hypothetical protein
VRRASCFVLRQILASTYGAHFANQRRGLVSDGENRRQRSRSRRILPSRWSLLLRPMRNVHVHHLYERFCGRAGYAFGVPTVQWRITLARVCVSPFKATVRSLTEGQWLATTSMIFSNSKAERAASSLCSSDIVPQSLSNIVIAIPPLSCGDQAAAVPSRLDADSAASTFLSGAAGNQMLAVALTLCFFASPGFALQERPRQLFWPGAIRRAAMKTQQTRSGCLRVGKFARRSEGRARPFCTLSVYPVP